jgi:hypothetical protein
MRLAKAGRIEMTIARNATSGVTISGRIYPKTTIIISIPKLGEC